MANMSKELKDMLSAFMLSEIQSKAIDGITYALKLNLPNNKVDIEEYLKIRDEANRCGFEYNQQFRVFKVNNGYIFDMDLETVKGMTMHIAKELYKIEGDKTVDSKQQLNDLMVMLQESPVNRRKKDIVALSNYILKEKKAGHDEVEVALFSRNSTNRIIIQGRYNNEPVEIHYNAYALRHWDMATINEKFLIPNGCRISRVTPCEILPSATGVSFILTIDRYGV